MADSNVLTKTCNPKQKALALALKFILNNDIASKQRLRDKFGLNQNTILRIEAGESLRSVSIEKYTETLVGIIDDYRWKYAEDDERHIEANRIFLDMFLLSMRRCRDVERRRKELLKFSSIN